MAILSRTMMIMRHSLEGCISFWLRMYWTITYVMYWYSRVSQYVYVPTRESFSEALDAHADTLEGDVKPPLVVLGEEGKLIHVC